MTEPREIDCTPVGMQTPEGVKRVNETHAAFEASAVALANACMAFFNEHEQYIMHCLSPYPILTEEVEELKKLIEQRRKASDAFLRAIAGR